MNGFNAFIKRPKRNSFSLLPVSYSEKLAVCEPGSRPSQTIYPHFDLGLPRLQNYNKFLLLLILLPHGILLWQAEWLKTTLIFLIFPGLCTFNPVFIHASAFLPASFPVCRVTQRRSRVE